MTRIIIEEKLRRISGKFYIFSAFVGLVFISSCSKRSEPDPELSIKDVSQVRTASESTVKFLFNLNKPTAGIVSVDYSFVDGTAIAAKDFVAASGTLSISPNQVQASLDIQIKGDPLNLRQPNLQFSVQLTNPKNCTIPLTSAHVTIITEDGTNLLTDNAGYSTPLIYPDYSLVWSDEFSGTDLDKNIWNQEIGNGSNGWGNNELEYYTDSPKNTFVSNGNLIIEARKETFDRFNYSSGRMTTQGNKYFKSGRIDIRAKLPVGKGIWPALWMLGNNISSVGWPGCGEIDIMELIGTFPGRISGTLHWKALSGSHSSKGTNFSLTSGDFSQQFHVFSIVWKQDNIKWYVDDQFYLECSATDVNPAVYPFNADQFFIFNVAVGGDWPGPPDYNTAFPQRMFVDYVRVFQ
jgi:beta-glucanase (GH16 family)